MSPLELVDDRFQKLASELRASRPAASEELRDRVRSLAPPPPRRLQLDFRRFAPAAGLAAAAAALTVAVVIGVVHGFRAHPSLSRERSAVAGEERRPRIAGVRSARPRAPRPLCSRALGLAAAALRRGPARAGPSQDELSKETRDAIAFTRKAGGYLVWSAYSAPGKTRQLRARAADPDRARPGGDRPLLGVRRPGQAADRAQGPAAAGGRPDGDDRPAAEGRRQDRSAARRHAQPRAALPARAAPARGQDPPGRADEPARGDRPAGASSPRSRWRWSSARSPPPRPPDASTGRSTTRPRCSCASSSSSSTHCWSPGRCCSSAARASSRAVRYDAAPTVSCSKASSSLVDDLEARLRHDEPHRVRP